MAKDSALKSTFPSSAEYTAEGIHIFDVRALRSSTLEALEADFTLTDQKAREVSDLS